MGQYYRTILFPISNIPEGIKEASQPLIAPDILNSIKDKTYLVFDANECEQGVKLMETAWIGNDFINFVIAHLYEQPRKVAWIGDYSDDTETPNFEDVYAAANQQLATLDFLEENGKIDPKNLPTEYATAKYIINHSQKLYIDMPKYIRQNTNDQGWCVNPLPILTACGNGQGGGDYFGENEEIAGEWAFEIIEYANETPHGYDETEVYFSED